jgi:uncharacterized membrane protein (UPF0127 family)
MTPAIWHTRPPRAACGALALLTLLALASLQPLRAQSPGAPLDLASYPRTELTITPPPPAKVHTFRVWVADTPQRAEQGLMFVSDLPASEGMVFPLEAPRVESMWMKNTYIELDMLFIGANGRVTKIIERAHPLSLEPLSSGAPVAAVLELKGGAAAKLGLKIGDAVRWRKPAA